MTEVCLRAVYGDRAVPAEERRGRLRQLRASLVLRAGDGRLSTLPVRRLRRQRQQVRDRRGMLGALRRLAGPLGVDADPATHLHPRPPTAARSASHHHRRHHHRHF